ncbi:uncharacterized protein LOC104897055 [Beta vulgaris subsp. vulgaris]|uniref:uncharacterized protein LOC104897055 n=1 Tax=Beta vulgaris subsp. vulgaris TaxID=3555 RepID=UPI002547C7AA|nr:uncharacterized protein LOC104897055 [Beta vulgaris subsp. vulgaris]
MGDDNNEKPLRDYAMPNASGAPSSIVRPTISANNFELHPALIQIIQQDHFIGLDNEDPNEHIITFLEKCDTVKLNGVTDDVIRLGLFPFSLRDKAKMWLKSNPPNSFTTWATLSQAFLSKYFPLGKTAKFRNNITSFAQYDGESLYEAWERITIDAAAGGAIMGKTTEVANRLEMASINYHWSNNRGKPKKPWPPNNDPYSNTFNPGWRNHPNFSWRNKDNKMLIIEKLETKVDQIAISNRNVELQLGQLANAINSRSQGALPSNTEVNPKQHCNAVTLRNGKELSIIKSTIKENEVANESEKEKENYEAEKEPELTPLPPLRPYVPPIPFPQRLKQTKLDIEFEKFLKMFKQLHINIPFIDALMQIPSNSKFLKEIMSKKKKLEKYETIALSEECSAVIQKKLPPKLKDPGSFSIPCIIGDIKFSRALCDLGASVSLMPLSICKKLRLHNIKSTTVSLQLADRSIKYPIGKLENVLIKVDKFIIPVDFIILDMDEDVEVPIILGRPFLATTGAIINVKNGILTFEIGEEKVHFNIFNSSKKNSQRDLVCQVDIIKDMTKNKHVIDATNVLLEVCLSKTSTPHKLKKEKVRKVFPPIKECFSWRKKGEFKTKGHIFDSHSVFYSDREPDAPTLLLLLLFAAAQELPASYTRLCLSIF